MAKIGTFIVLWSVALFLCGMSVKNNYTDPPPKKKESIVLSTHFEEIVEFGQVYHELKKELRWSTQKSYDSRALVAATIWVLEKKERLLTETEEKDY